MNLEYDLGGTSTRFTYIESEIEHFNISTCLDIARPLNDLEENLQKSAPTFFGTKLWMSCETPETRSKDHHSPFIPGNSANVTFLGWWVHVTLLRGDCDLQRLGMKRSRLESPGRSLFLNVFHKHGICCFSRGVVLSTIPRDYAFRGL